MFDLGQKTPEEDLNHDLEELQWAYEQGAQNTQEALTLISKHRRSVGK